MRYLIALIFISGGLNLAAQHSSPFLLVENRGQWPEQVQYAVDVEGGKMFVEDEGFTYHFFDLSPISSIHGTSQTPVPGTLRARGHVYKVNFENCNSNSTTRALDKQSIYYNYFLGNDESTWAGGCGAFGKVVRNNLYDGIDQVIYSNDFFLKYDFIVRPGTNASQIRMRYDEVDELKIENGKLVIRTSVNEVWEQKPIAWQVIDGAKKLVSCNYQIAGDVVTYVFPNGYDESHELIIDPELIFSTYSGSFSDNFGYTATYDSEGYLYSGSSAFGQGYPTTAGAYQVTWGGGDGQGTLAGTDIALSKYDVTGTFMVWSTFLGGEHDELPHSLICNEFDELLVYGTTSSPDFPVTSGAYNNTYNGGIAFAPSGVGADYVNGSDIIVARFTHDGDDLINSTFLGGSGNDGVNTASILKFNYADEFRGEIDIDLEGNVIIASSTYSTDFPMISPVQSTLQGGQEACLVKLNPDLSDVIWSTYIGGNQDDSGYSVAFDSDNNIYFCGGTKSANFPVTVGVFQPTNNGGTAEGWIAKIDSAGDNYLLGTFYGSNEYDQLYFVETDDENNVHVYGQTLANDNTFIFNAAFNEPNSGMLVAKFTPELDELIWSTVFGSGEGEPNLSPTAFLVDVCGKVYLSGWGGTTNTNSNQDTDNVFDMSITDDAYQNLTNGGEFYLMIIEADASALVFASYFGGMSSQEHVDGGTSRFDRKGVIYQSVCAGCGNNDDFPIYPADAVSPTNNSNNCNNGVFKFDFELPFTTASFTAPNLECVNEPIQFTNTSNWSTSQFWDFGDDITTTLFNPTHMYAQPGTYTVMLVANHPGTCNATDTIYQEIEIGIPSNYSLDDEITCVDQTILIGPDSVNLLYEYLWTPDIYLSTNNVGNPTYTPGSSQDYLLIIDHGCIDSVLVHVDVIDLSLSVPNDTSLCDNETLVLDALVDPANADITWSLESDFSNPLNDGPDDHSIEIDITIPTTLYILAEMGECSLTEEVFVNLVSFQTMVEGDFTVCINDITTLSVLDPNPDFTYAWGPDELIISGQNTPTAEVLVTEETTFYIYATTDADCTAADSVVVSVSDLLAGNMDATAEPDIILEGETSQLDADPSGEYDYDWSPGDDLSNSNIENPIATPDVTTTYYVTISDGECEHTDSVTVRVVDFFCGPPNVYVPNAFTPNADSNNEMIYVHGNYITKLFFVIYDRWGEKVFETDDINIGWDGTFKGRKVDPAVFVYYLEVTCEGGFTYFDKGNISVIR